MSHQSFYGAEDNRLGSNPKMVTFPSNKTKLLIKTIHNTLQLNRFSGSVDKASFETFTNRLFESVVQSSSNWPLHTV